MLVAHLSNANNYIISGERESFSLLIPLLFQKGQGEK